jgi:hypothetical protein
MVVAGAGAPHAHDTTTELSRGASSGALDPPVRTTMGGAERSSLTHTSCGKQPQLAAQKAKKPLSSANGGVHTYWLSATPYNEGGRW